MEKEVEEKLGGIYDGKFEQRLIQVIVPSILQYVCTACLPYGRSSWCSSPRRPVGGWWEELVAWVSDNHHAICKGGGGGRGGKGHEYSLWWEHFFLHNDEVVLVFQIISSEVVAAGLVSFLVFDGVSPRFD
uniref:Uncharacterized protein n=1 Tax=Oryza glumipatula TaxID=40148 RepID=A0A0D9YBX9_9ORYZ